MHEISIAGAMIDIAIDAAIKNNASKVKEVKIEIGELTSINPDQLGFIFETLSKNTILEGAEFKISTIKAEIRCDNCEYLGPIEFFEKLHFLLPVIRCPKCEGSDIEILAGRNCNVKSIKIT